MFETGLAGRTWSAFVRRLPPSAFSKFLPSASSIEASSVRHPLPSGVRLRTRSAITGPEVHVSCPYVPTIHTV